MTVAVVILNWNGQELLKQFLPFVIKHSKDANIYVADNASTDASIAYIENNYPEITIIKNQTNGGFAKGYNEALKHLEEDLFCLLNSDVEVTTNWLDPIISTFKQEQQTAIIQPKILDFNNKICFEYAGAAGGFIDKYGYPYCRGRIFDTLEKDQNQYNNNTEIFWASGACFFIRRSTFNKLQGFDELFFAHMEEIDLCWRAKKLNYTVKYIGNSTVYHVGGATLGSLNPKKTFLNFRNSLFMLTKNLEKNLALIIFTRLILDGLAAFKFLLEFKFKHVLAILKAHFSYYWHINKILKKRNKKDANGIKHYQIKSIVFEYFVNKNKKFTSL